MDKQFVCLNQILNVEGFDIQNNTVSLTIDQLTAFNNAMDSATKKASKLDDVITNLNAIDETIENAETNEDKIASLKTLIEKRPGVSASNQTGNDKHDTELNYTPDEINNYFN